jgi:NhaA family Na+:H+ antiporter
VLIVEEKLSRMFNEFFHSEKSAGLLLILCTGVSMLIANLPFGAAYVDFWHLRLAGLTLEHWVNDGLMAIFFLLIGLELERELYAGELSDIRRALLPIFAAAGGVIVPALIHLGLNYGTATQAGIGIPMATDIAFALGVLALVGRSVPASLKVFLVALAVMDDLAAIIVIALFYTSDVSSLYLGAALSLFAAMMVMNRVFKVMALAPYLGLGAIMWFLTLKSGVHATIAGVLLAFAIPFATRTAGQVSPSSRLEQVLHKPVAYGVLPIFALANTAIVLGSGWADSLTSPNSLGIVLGLLVGKPIGILALSFLAIALGLCRLPADLAWRHIAGAGLLGGIGFTMSIFIANLAFPGQAAVIDSSKMAVLTVSLVAGSLGFLWLKLFGHPVPLDTNPQTMDLAVSSTGKNSQRARD